jgi:hypothetical protein
MEKGDGDAGEAAKSFGCVAAGAPSHGLARLWGRCLVELSRRGRVGAPCGRWGAVTVSPSVLHGHLGKASGRRSALEDSVRVDEASRASEYELGDKDEKEEKKERK